MRWQKPIIFVATHALLLAGCGNDFSPASFIDRTRILGAQLRVLGSTPLTSSALPGENVELEFYIATPRAPEVVTATVFACVAAEVRRGEAFCLGAPFAMSNLDTQTNSSLRANFMLPNETAFSATRTVLFAGVACFGGGTPSLEIGADPTQRTARCTGNATARAELISYVATLASSASADRNAVPDASSLSVQFGADADTATQALSSSNDACAEGVTRVQLSSLRERPENKRRGALRISAPSTLRDVYTPLPSATNPQPTPIREVLQISQFVTAGTIGSFVIFEGESSETSVDNIDWTIATAEVPASGLNVVFYFVLRDLRGGQSLAKRSVCMVP